MDVLVDTSAVVAMMVRRDQRHSVARAFGRSPNLRVHTTSAVLGEIHTIMRSRHGFAPARTAVRGLQQGQTSTIVHVDDAFDASIWALIDEFAGVPLSYEDASLVVLGRRLRIQQVFGFDDDLRAAGLELVPGEG